MPVGFVNSFRRRTRQAFYLEGWTLQCPHVQSQLFRAPLVIPGFTVEIDQITKHADDVNEIVPKPLSCPLRPATSKVAILAFNPDKERRQLQCLLPFGWTPACVSAVTFLGHQAAVIGLDYAKFHQRDCGIEAWLIRAGYLRRKQLHRLPGLPQDLKQHLGLGLEQGDPMLQIGGMALQLTADLQPIAQEHGP